MHISDKYKNIFYINDFEIVPKWKRCGEYNPDWSYEEKLLWGFGDFDYHMELVENKKEFFERYWYVWNSYRCGDVCLNDDGTFMARMKDVMIGWDSPKYENIEKAIEYVMACYKAKKKYYKEKN